MRVLAILLVLFAGLAAARDFYKILGVDKKASEQDIKRAYRKLSLKYHPDKNPSPDAAEKFADLSAAYEALSDPEKRKIYDMHGEDGLQQHQQRSNQPSDPFSVFEAFGFGGFGRRHNDEPRTPNVEVPLRVSLRQLYVGEILETSYVRQVLCVDHNLCQETCRDCAGPGIRLRTHQLAPGFVQQIQQRDDNCVARGKCWKPNCKACPNGMTETEEIQLTLDVQRGMRTGDFIRFEEVADELPGHLAGDLVFVIVETEHPTFRREGNDLYMTLTISLVDALVGFETTITHLDGHPVKITKADVTYCGQVIAVRGEGMPIRGSPGQFGHLFVTLTIDFPKQLTEQQKAQIKQVLA